MSSNSAIGWTDDTWPAVVVGCTRCSEGCLHCYIERTAPFRIAGRRFDGPGIGASTGIEFHEQRLAWPLHRRQGRRIFVNSQADLFHPDVPTSVLVQMLAVMAASPRHTYQVLTKRPARMRHLFTAPRFQDQVQNAMDLPFIGERAEAGPEDFSWPLPNLWLGVSAETQRWLENRVRDLRGTPAAIRCIDWTTGLVLIVLNLRDHSLITEDSWALSGCGRYRVWRLQGLGGSFSGRARCRAGSYRMPSRNRWVRCGSS